MTPVLCPKCGSPQVSGQAKGFGVGKAVVGGLLLGPLGLLAGTSGSKTVLVNCLACGNQWTPGAAPPAKAKRDVNGWVAFFVFAAVIGGSSIALATCSSSSSATPLPPSAPQQSASPRR